MAVLNTISCHSWPEGNLCMASMMFLRQCKHRPLVPDSKVVVLAKDTVLFHTD